MISTSIVNQAFIDEKENNDRGNVSLVIQHAIRSTYSFKMALMLFLAI